MWYIIPIIIVLLFIPGVIRNTQTPRNLGVSEGMLSPLPASPNAVSSQTEDSDRLVEPLPFLGTQEESRNRVIEAAQAYGRMKLVESRPDYLRIVFTTPVFRFRDDVEFYFDMNAELIHVRSASRIGYSDMGLNRQRYEAIRLYYLGGSP